MSDHPERCGTSRLLLQRERDTALWLAAEYRWALEILLFTLSPDELSPDEWIQRLHEKFDA